MRRRPEPLPEHARPRPRPGVGDRSDEHQPDDEVRACGRLDHHGTARRVADQHDADGADGGVGVQLVQQPFGLPLDPQVGTTRSPSSQRRQEDDAVAPGQAPAHARPGAVVQAEPGHQHHQRLRRCPVAGHHAMTASMAFSARGGAVRMGLLEGVGSSEHAQDQQQDDGQQDRDQQRTQAAHPAVEEKNTARC